MRNILFRYSYLKYLMVAIISVAIYHFYWTNPITDSYQRYTVTTDNKNFDDVMYDLQFAIRDYNFRITSINRIGEAIITNEQDFIQANIVSFCNISFAKKFLEQSVKYLLYMPCRAVIYEQENQIVVETYLFTKYDALHLEINAMLKKILDASIR